MARYLLIGYFGGVAGVVLASVFEETFGMAVFGGVLGLAIGLPSGHRTTVARNIIAGFVGMPLGLQLGWFVGGNFPEPFGALAAVVMWGGIVGLAFGLAPPYSRGRVRSTLAGAAGMPFSLIVVIGLSIMIGGAPNADLAFSGGFSYIFAAWGGFVGLFLATASFLNDREIEVARLKWDSRKETEKKASEIKEKPAIRKKEAPEPKGKKKESLSRDEGPSSEDKVEKAGGTKKAPKDEGKKRSRKRPEKKRAKKGSKGRSKKGS
ncbi:MAG: hypothetical protein QF415_13025 [Candidatus Undinarchaeales archaeon]|nr:hypothetical protein [Candidatus Undinarchaeales archaeon]